MPSLFSGLATVPISILAGLVANGSRDILVVGPLVALALVQIASGIRINPDRSISWTPVLMVFPVIAGSTFLLATMVRLGAAFEAEDRRVLEMASWGVGLLTACTSAGLAWSLTLRKVNELVVVAVALGSSMWLALAVFASLLVYSPLIDNNGKYQPSLEVQVCQESLASLRLALAEEQMQGGRGPNYQRLADQARAMQEECLFLQSDDVRRITAIEASRESNPGSRLPLLQLAHMTVLATFSATFGLLLAGGRSTPGMGVVRLSTLGWRRRKPPEPDTGGTSLSSES